MAGLAAFASASFGQDAGTQSGFEAFEVATVKPTAPEETGVNKGRFIRMQSAHRFQAKNYTVNGLIAAAYDLNPKIISGGPAWAETDRYDVMAATPGYSRPSYEDQMRMLRKLLSDRFNLRFHRRKEEFPIFELTVAKSGPKLRLSSAPPGEPYNVTTTLYPAASGGIDHALLPANNITMGSLPRFCNGRYSRGLWWTIRYLRGGTTLTSNGPGRQQFWRHIASGTARFTEARPLHRDAATTGVESGSDARPIDTLVIDGLDRPSDN